MTPRADRIVRLLARLPGVGEKTAQRYLLFLLTAEPDVAAPLGQELLNLRETLRPCSECNNLAEVTPGQEVRCAICRDARRDSTLLCVVGKVHDLFAIERTGSMRGIYFVLGKLLAPLDGVSAADLPMKRLVDRIRARGVKEVILATPPSVDGEATALFVRRELAELAVAVTRIASGVPHGGDLEFADPITMGRALSGRQAL